jgi:hypothetical protein
MVALKNAYECSICGRLIEPKEYDSPESIVIKLENELIKIPIERMRFFYCCSIKNMAPYHNNRLEYIDAVREILPFHIDEYWVEKILR